MACERDVVHRQLLTSNFALISPFVQSSWLNFIVKVSYNIYKLAIVILSGVILHLSPDIECFILKSHMCLIPQLNPYSVQLTIVNQQQY